MARAAPPRWLWRLAWLALAAALAGGIGGALALGAGPADPPRAGPLLWQDDPQPIWTLPLRAAQVREAPFDLPKPPFTLEVTARFSAGSDPESLWGVGLAGGYSFIIDSGGAYSALTDIHIPFPHIRPVGEFNKLALDVALDQTATLRLNDEIAWRGSLIGYSPTAAATRWTLLARAGRDYDMTLTWERIAIYAPP